MAKKQTKLQMALDDIEACGDALRWVNGKSPAKAWKECKRPDWLLWLIARLAEEEKYYERALASSLAVCIDVLCDNDSIHSQYLAKESDSDERAYSLKVSTALDKIGQGKRVRYRQTEVSTTGEPVSLHWALDTLLGVGEDLLRYGLRYGTADDLSAVSEAPRKLHSKMCDEIRRVTERPLLEEVQTLAAKLGRY